MSKAQRGDRSFQPGAGKGDASRITDVQAFRENYDQIDWGRRRIVPILYRRALPAPKGWDKYYASQMVDAGSSRGDWEDSF